MVLSFMFVPTNFASDIIKSFINKMWVLLQYFMLVYRFICENKLTTSICNFLRNIHNVVM